MTGIEITNGDIWSQYLKQVWTKWPRCWLLEHQTAEVAAADTIPPPPEWEESESEEAHSLVWFSLEEMGVSQNKKLPSILEEQFDSF